MIEKCQPYRHYKGHFHFALVVAKHSETQEELVVYERWGFYDVWARPRKMFEEKLEDGRQRFVLIK